MPVPGPMSRTIPVAVLRIGGMRAAEPTRAGWSSSSEPGVGAGAGLRWIVNIVADYVG